MDAVDSRDVRSRGGRRPDGDGPARTRCWTRPAAAGRCRTLRDRRGVLATSGWQNPTLTEMAVTARPATTPWTGSGGGQFVSSRGPAPSAAPSPWRRAPECRKPSAVRSMPARRSLAAAEEDRRDREVHLVRQPGAEVLADGRDAAPEPDVLSRRPPPRARSSASWMPPVTKWKVVPPFIPTDGRCSDR